MMIVIGCVFSQVASGFLLMAKLAFSDKELGKDAEATAEVLWKNATDESCQRSRIAGYKSRLTVTETTQSTSMS